jgi:hypothetical protein
MTTPTLACQHTDDNAANRELLRECPQCGARCSETQIGDDDLCYDENCPLHTLAGPPVTPQRCESGEWSGVPCDYAGDDLERVTYVPAQHRGTAGAAGSWHGLTSTIRVCPACAEQMRENDPDWVRFR